MEYSQEQTIALQDALHNMYEDNMEFLKIYDKSIYNEISNLSNKIDNNEYEVRYELEFINNSFNIYDKHKKEYIYKNSLDEYNANVSNELDYSNKNIISNAMTKNYDIENIEELRLFDNDIQTNSYKKVIKDIEKFKDIVDGTNTHSNGNMKYIPTFIFFGTLLGSHLFHIKQKFKSKSYLIIEPDIEIFRLSLFITEYKLLSENSRLFFSVGDNYSRMVNKMENYILYDLGENYKYKYYSTSYHAQNLFNNFAMALGNTNPFSFDHYRQLSYIDKSINRINKFPTLIESDFSSTLENLPVLILSPGPSLREKVKWVKKNYKNFITLAFGATVKILNEFDIKPDIITSVDASTLILNQFPKECESTYKEAVILLGTDSHKEVVKLFKQENIFVYETNVKILMNGMEESSSTSVGENALHILLTMGFKEIYMLGTDLAIDIDTEIAYDKTHLKSTKDKHCLHYLRKNIKKISEDIDINDKYIKVASNFKNKTLYSDPLFLKIIEGYTSIIEMHKEKYPFKVFNLSKGAFIPNTTPLSPKEVRISTIKKDKKNRYLKEFFLNKSQKGFLKEKDEFSNEVEFLDDLISFIKNIKKINIGNDKSFYTVRKKYIQKIIEHKSYSLMTVSFLLTHIQVIDNYINLQFNNENFYCNESKLENIKLEWCKQVLNKLKEYQKILKKALI